MLTNIFQIQHFSMIKTSQIRGTSQMIIICPSEVGKFLEFVPAGRGRAHDAQQFLRGLGRVAKSGRPRQL